MTPPDQAAPHVPSRICLIGSAATLGQALQIANGFYDDRALIWLTGAFVLALMAVFGWRPRGSAEDFWARLHREDWLRFVMILAVGWQIVSLMTAPPGMYLQPRANLGLFKAGVIAEAVIIAIGVAGPRMFARAWFPALLAVHFALGVWLLRASPSPHIDVVTVHREAFDALTSGRSPYAISFENIYGANSGFYNPALLEGNRVLFGYPYPPVSLMAALPGHLIAGDYRYAQLTAWILAAAVIGQLGTPMLSRLAAAVLLTQPRGFFVLEQGWTEPIALFALVLTIFAMTKRPALASWFGGIMVVTKQYLAIGVPLLWRFALRRQKPWRFLLAAAGIAALVTLPFVAWQPRAFVESVVLLQMREPFRIDSLSYLSWAARHDLGAGSVLWSLAAAIIVLGLGMVVTPNTPAGFALTLAVSAFATFAFGSKAFCNYYFFVAGALCCVAAMDQESSRSR